MKPIEILAPAGSLDSLYGALKLGADAVYTGTSRFGARAYADNPSVEEIADALVYAHLRKKKIYLTVNTLLNDKELEEELFPMILPLYEAGLDACIVQDFGVLSFLHEYFPDMDLHASTQMTLFSGDEANLLKPLGVTRYVPARELTIEEIREARKQTDLEIEVFVHGALCYCYSGQCLMSEVIGGRSGNRGMCAQPCRLSYHTPFGDGHVLNTKDICTLTKIPELVDAGIDSFKIEGRMKKREYSAYMAHVYREYVTFYQEEGREAFDKLVGNPDSRLWKDVNKSRDIFNRGGFSDSFLFEKKKEDMVYPARSRHFGTLAGEVIKCGKNQAVFKVKEPLQYQDVLEFRNPDGTAAYEYTVKNAAKKGETVTANIKRGSRIFPGQPVYRTRNASLLESISKQIENADDKILLRGKFTGQIGKPVSLTMEGNGVSVTAEGEVLQEASKRPVSVDDIKSRLCALGETGCRMEAPDITFPEHAFLSLGGVKKLRREALAQWEREAAGFRSMKVQYKERMDGLQKEIHSEKLSRGTVAERTFEGWVEVSDGEQLKAAVAQEQVSVLYVLKLLDYPAEGWGDAVKLLDGRPFALTFPRILRGKGRKSFEEKWEKYGRVFCKIVPEAIVVNSFRSYLYARDFFPGRIWYADENLYCKNGRARKEYEKLGMIPAPPRSYGRCAVMVTEGCVAATLGQCGGGVTRLSLTGPKGDAFEAVMHCDSCFNTIYTKEPMTGSRGAAVRLDFTWESGDEVREVMREWNL